MRGNIGIQKRLVLIFNKLTLCERLFVKDSRLLKRLIFSKTLKNSKHIDDIDSHISDFENYSGKLKKIISSVNSIEIPLDKIKKNRSSKDGNKEERNKVSSA